MFNENTHARTSEIAAPDLHVRTRSSTLISKIHLGTIEPAEFTLLQSLLLPTTVTLMLVAFAALLGDLSPPYIALAILSFVITPQILTQPDLMRGEWNLRTKLPRLLFEWGLLIAVLLFLAFALKATEIYSRRVLLLWFATTPLALVAVEAIAQRAVRYVVPAHPKVRTHVIVGANQVGRELARRLGSSPFNGFQGYFDDRALDRLDDLPEERLLGKLTEVAAYARKHAIHSIYIALPVWSSPRMVQLISELRDTTASVYIVPDLFAFELIQARFVDIGGIPAMSICDTPFQGQNALVKRASDLALGIVALLAFLPVMIAIALMVKFTSPGPVLFKQRRYGLDGEEIKVYKFRSMRVCEDGAAIVQAQRGDHRLTSIGRFLRRTSLDELPQLFNVIQGRMSLVGPRPHAVAHNEMYRGLINGYMLRHKIRPGMTGWAQVNGLRGETETVEKMRERVEYDLDYLRQWSVWLDVKILVRTALMIVRDPNAY